MRGGAGGVGITDQMGLIPCFFKPSIMTLVGQKWDGKGRVGAKKIGPGAEPKGRGVGARHHPCMAHRHAKPCQLGVFTNGGRSLITDNGMRKGEGWGGGF